MSRYQHLPIYKKSYEMLTRTVVAIKSFPREHKFTIGQKIHEEVVELVVLIYRANATADKERIIDEILERVEVIGLLVRLSHDLRILQKTHYAALVEMTESISRQAQGWRKFSRKDAVNSKSEVKQAAQSGVSPRL